jgi:arylsulfatase A-like enzyme
MAASCWDRAALGLLLALALGAASCSRGEAPGPRPNVLFVLVDTLRADHLSCYGYERETSPRVDALAREGWLFENHLAHAGQTVPSTISMLVSKYPAEHGFVHLGDGHFARNPPYFDDELVFLAEVFERAGYRTGGFVGNPFLKRKTNFAQGFERFMHSRGRGSEHVSAALDWLLDGDDEPDQPYFVYLHLMDVHSPYRPPAEYARLFTGPSDGRLLYRNGPAPEMRPADLAVTTAAYDAGIRYVDDLIAGLLERLEEAGLLDDTIVVFTSDHGDEFLEHGGLGHGTSVYGELVRVPLILHAPGRLGAPQRVAHMTQHVDLAPSLLELVGIAAPAGFRGRSVFEPASVVYAENGPWRAVWNAAGKLVVQLDEGRFELYGADDPLDQRQLDDPELRATLGPLLDTYVQVGAARGAGSEALDARAWSGEELDRLRALGYAE